MEDHNEGSLFYTLDESQSQYYLIFRKNVKNLKSEILRSRSSKDWDLLVVTFTVMMSGHISVKAGVIWICEIDKVTQQNEQHARSAVESAKQYRDKSESRQRNDVDCDELH
jgi:hypothetical protein